MPILAAMSGIGSRRALRAISRSVGNPTFIAPSPSLEARQHLAPPSLRRLDLVEREYVQTGNSQVRPREVRPQGAHETPRFVTARAKHASHPARMAAQESGGVGDADLCRHAQQPRGVGDAGHADVDGKRHAAVTYTTDPPLNRLGVEALVDE